VRTNALVIMLMFSLSAQEQQTVLDVITLKYRSAEQVIPLLEPLLAPGATISGLQNRVILRTTPQNLAELRSVIDQIDGMPRRLTISVRQDSIDSASRSEVGISGSVGTDRARATLPENNGGPGARVEIRRGDDRVGVGAQQSQSAATGRGVQTVQVLEGNEAYISLGQSVPVRSRSVIQGPQGTRISESVEYRNANTGFHAIPRVSGDRVTVSIRSRRDSLADANSATLGVQRIDTAVSGRLGEWLEIGAAVQQSTGTDGGTVTRSSSLGFDDRRVFLKVEEVK
jgi:type II secretory pathway component GspD/PulD (secretin)